jgi:hypothetical protein
MKRRDLLTTVAALALCRAAVAGRPPAEQARIDKLIAAVGEQSEIKFIRNGKEYSCTQAVEFLRGKLKWRMSKVNTVQDFIDEVGTRSTTSGDVYTVRLPSGEVIPSAQFLRQELARIEKR